MPVKSGDAITAEWANRVEGALGLDDLTDAPGFSGPGFRARKSRGGGGGQFFLGKAGEDIAPRSRGKVYYAEDQGGDGVPWTQLSDFEDPVKNDSQVTIPEGTELYFAEGGEPSAWRILNAFICADPPPEP